MIGEHTTDACRGHVAFAKFSGALADSTRITFDMLNKAAPVLLKTHVEHSGRMDIIVMGMFTSVQGLSIYIATFQRIFFLSTSG